MIHTCESGHFVTGAAFTPTLLWWEGGGRREGWRERRKKAACNVSHTTKVSCCVSDKCSFPRWPQCSVSDGCNWGKTPQTYLVVNEGQWL